MKNAKQNLKSFADSHINSNEEQTFLDSTITAFYDEKLRRKYAETLEKDYNITRPTSDSAPTKSRNIPRIILIALSLVTLCLAVFFLSKLNSGNQETTYYAADVDPYYTEIDFNTRGEATQAQTLLDISIAYDKKDFKAVSALYTQLESMDIQDNYLHAIAVSLLKNGENQEAFNVWNKLLASEESIYSYHNVARLFMGRTMVESGTDMSQGINLLEQVKPESKYHATAQDLIKKYK